jgi:hypothetical protein
MRMSIGPFRNNRHLNAVALYYSHNCANNGHTIHLIVLFRFNEYLWYINI